MLVTNEPQPDGTPSVSRYTGRRWHSDMSHTTVPSLGSLLRCWTVPEIGGDTLFANMYLAYESLSAGMQKLISTLHAIHVPGSRKIDDTAAGHAHADEQRRISPPVAQPVVRVHPETGRKALYLGEKVGRFEGMTRDESRPLMDYLNRHATRPEFVYRHQWRANDIRALGQSLHDASSARGFRSDPATAHGANYRDRHTVGIPGCRRLTTSHLNIAVWS
jgi:taurine dioxygenase